MRNFSTTAKRAMNDQNNKGQVWLYLLDISSLFFPTMRFVDNNVNITSGGNTYLARAFTFAPPAESQGQSYATGSIRLDNVDLAIGKLLLLMQRDSRIDIVVRKIIAAEPSTALQTLTFALKRLVVTDSVAEITVGSSDDSESDGLPWLVYNYGSNRGLFERGTYIAGLNLGGAPVNVPSGPPPDGGGEG